WSPQTIKGDVNSDGVFNIADLVALQKWILADSDTELKDWKIADLNNDDKLDVFDIVIMRRCLLNEF
ncbi:MAG: dockerin type I repeat-containing protein, partial [Ruminococcus sp.]|nr:dockerin type I repeat-containing protein [Ruminococcus sp.]